MTCLPPHANGVESEMGGSRELTAMDACPDESANFAQGLHLVPGGDPPGRRPTTADSLPYMGKMKREERGREESRRRHRTFVEGRAPPVGLSAGDEQGYLDEQFQI